MSIARRHTRLHNGLAVQNPGGIPAGIHRRNGGAGFGVPILARNIAMVNAHMSDTADNDSNNSSKNESGNLFRELRTGEAKVRVEFHAILSSCRDYFLCIEREDD
ncbi:MAG: hypothetical protein WDO70_02080 [Alphaproteobacteria bacterium]